MCGEGFEQPTYSINNSEQGRVMVNERMMQYSVLSSKLMIMKKPIAALSLVLILSLLPSNLANAAVKAGVACSKAGTTSIASGKKFTCIKSGNKLVWNKGQVKVIAQVELVPQLSPEKLSNCQIKDQRPAGSGPYGEAIAFPVTDFNREQKLPVIGTAKVAFIPIDFSDVPGKGRPLDFGQSQIDSTNEWLTWYTNGKLTYEWQTYNSWIRAPKPSTQYNWAHPVHGGYQGQAAPQAQSTEEIIQQLVTAASPHFNFEGVGAVFLLFPKEVKAIEIEITQRNRTWQTAQGPQQFSFFGPGAEINNRGDSLWGWWMHEVLHSHGFSGHFPFGFLNLHMMIGGWQSNALSSWDALIAGWSNEEDVYCLSKEKVTKTALTLSPLDRKQRGLKSVMIKLNDHQVLVFESRRSEKWSSPQLYINGLMGYIVDTKIINDREGESANQERTRTATYLTTDQRKVNGSNMFPGCSRTQCDRTMVYANTGQTFTFDGIKVTLTKSGINDEILIEKIS